MTSLQITTLEGFIKGLEKNAKKLRNGTVMLVLQLHFLDLGCFEDR